MYKNKFLAIIKKDGTPLREVAGQYVHLPFNSEYSIELRNDHPYRRALAKVFIDGTEVTGTGIVINAQSSINLERFLMDGNLEKGNRFKFVSVEDAPGVDPKNSQNGMVRVEFWLEQSHIWTSYTSDWYSSSVTPTYTYDTFISNQTLNTKTLLCDSATNSVTNLVINNTGNAGVTTEGSVSNQRFHTTSFQGIDTNTHTIIELTLRGVETELTNKDKIYCTQCGKKIKPTFSFCPHCGQRVEL